jgi:glycosyl transferase family 87
MGIRSAVGDALGGRNVRFHVDPGTIASDFLIPADLHTTHNANHHWRSILLLLLVLAASSEFFIRGPLRLLHGTEWNDFLSPYIQSRAWLRGVDPYSAENFVRLWPSGKPIFSFVTKDAAAGTLIFKRGVPSPYPITSFVVLAPLALLPWKLAQFVWIFLSLFAIAFIIQGLRSLLGTSWRDPRAWAFVAFALALAPLHTGLFTENPIIVVLGMGVAALWAAKYPHNYLAGVALALAICLKPQVGLCFLLLFLVQRRWKTVTTGCAITAVLTAIGIARLAGAGSPWLTSYLEASHTVFARGAINDFTPANPIWFHMLNLQVVFFPLLGKAGAANLAAIAVTALAGLAWLRYALISDRDSDQLLTLSALAVISLLPVYHRSYDAALLIFPVAWALLGNHRQPAVARACVILSVLFLTPGGVLVNLLAEQAHRPGAIVNSWWWRSLIVGHQAWALLALAVFLSWARMRDGIQCGSELANESEIGHSTHGKLRPREPLLS